MTQDTKCALGLHKYEVLEQKIVKNAYGIEVGSSIISRCSNCGKIKVKTIYTDTNNLR
jgi:hypothetical protein